MIDSRNLVPKAYSSSRDYQVFLKLLNLIIQATKSDIDNFINLIDFNKSPNSVLKLLASYIGYTYNYKLSVQSNRLIMKYYNSMIRNRGSNLGIKLATILAVNSSLNFDDISLISSMSVYFNDHKIDKNLPTRSINPDTGNPYTSNDDRIEVYLANYNNLPFVKEMIELVRPAGVPIVVYPAIEENIVDKVDITGNVSANPHDNRYTNNSSVSSNSNIGFSETNTYYNDSIINSSSLFLTGTSDTNNNRLIYNDNTYIGLLFSSNSTINSISYSSYGKNLFNPLVTTVVCDNQFRYIRDTISGNNINNDNLWVEIQAINNSANVAQGKTVTASFTTPDIGSLSSITDGNISSTNYTGKNTNSSNTSQYVVVDLGQVYDINRVIIYHYYSDSRIYNGSKTEVSADGNNWYTIYDSSVNGTYKETDTGNIIYSNISCSADSLTNIITINGMYMNSGEYSLLKIAEVFPILSGSNTLSTNYVSGSISPNTSLKLSFNDSSNNVLNNITINNNNYNTSITHTNTISNNFSCSYLSNNFINNGSTFYNYKFKLQLEIGSSSTNFEIHKESSLLISSTINPNDLFTYDGSDNICRINEANADYSGSLLAYSNGIISVNSSKIPSTTYNYSINKGSGDE